MKLLFLSIISVFLIKGFLTDELDVHLTTKNTHNIEILLRRLFPTSNADKKLATDVTIDVEVVDKALPSSQSSDLSNQHYSRRCYVCIKTIKFYESSLDPSKTAADIQKVFIGMCDILKANRRTRCIRFYKIIGIQIIKDVLKKVDPRLVCQRLNMCRYKNEEWEIEDIVQDVDLLLRTIYQRLQDCKHCQRAIKQFENVIDSSRSVGFVINKLSAICRLYKMDIWIDCRKYFSSTVVQQFYKSILAHECPFKICQRLGLCKRRENDLMLNGVSSVMEQHHYSQGCRVCVSLVKNYETIIDRSNSALDIQKIFSGTCEILKSNHRSNCIDFYKTRGLEAIKDILKGVDPRKVCQHFKMCRHKMEKSEFEDVLQNVYLLAKSVPNRQHDCKHCLKVTKRFEDIIDSTQSLNAVMGWLSDTCYLYKFTVQVKCFNYFKKSAVILFYKSILACDSPFNICKEKGICKETDNDSGLKVHVENFTPKELCKEVLHFLDQMKTNRMTRIPIGNRLYYVCSRTPSCQAILKFELFEIVRGFYDGLEHDQICKKVKGYGTGTEVTNAKTTDIIGCFICKEVMIVLKRIITDKSKEEIKKALEKVCFILQGPLRSACQDFVRRHSGEIIDFLIKGLTGDEICRLLQLCGVNEMSSENTIFSLSRKIIL